MESCITDFLNEKLIYENYAVLKTDKYKKKLKKLTSKIDEFSGKLKEKAPELADMFDDLMDEYNDFASYELRETFINGFCVGAKLADEMNKRVALMEEDNTVIEEERE